MHKFLNHMTQNENGHREKSHTPHSIKLVNTRLKPVLGTFIKTIYIILPVMFSCCTIEDPEGFEDEFLPLEIIYPDNTKATSSDRLDVFTFNDDQMMSLDSYQRIEGTAAGQAGIRSQNGDKLIFACANSTHDIYEWAEINSFGSLENIDIRLSEERRGRLVMTGSGHAEAGQRATCTIGLSPMASEVWLRSLACDFSLISGYGRNLQDIKVYLTNVNSACCLTSESVEKPKEIMNQGKLDEDALSKMREPDIIMQNINVHVGIVPYRADIRLLCYPNSCLTEGPGTPFTRLVIEGKLDDETYWWPININRGEGISNPGIHRNCRYIYDIILKRKGSKDPDTAIEMEHADIKLETRQWNEKDNYSVSF